MAKEYTTNKTTKYPHPLIQKTELITGTILTLTAIFLHLIFMQCAGAFWRDEADSIALAIMPSISDTWHYLNYSAFPILPSLILRLWIGLVMGSEWGLRAYGFMMGVSILGMLWLNGRLLSYRVPLLSIALFVFNPLSIRVGDAIRPYGIGIFLMLLTFGLLWKVIQEARPWQIAAGTIAVILSVQCLYQNTFFILAVVCAGVIVTICDKRWKRAVLLVAIGMAGAVSLLPYQQIIKKSYDGAIIMKSSTGFLSIWHTLSEALNVSRWINFKIWIGLFFLGICIYIYFQAVRLNSSIPKIRRDITLFCTITMIIYAVLFLLFLRFVSIVRVWYYLPLMVVAAVFLDVILSSLNLWNVLRIALAILAAAATFGVSWQTVHIRQTNMDIIASTLEKSAGKNDLIVVNPWYLAVGFQQYYHGTAPFTTLPPIKDYKIHRYDLIKAKMASADDPIEPVLSETSRTLKSGGSVWIVGWMRGVPPPENYLPQPLPPAPNSIYGWSENEYTISWEQQFMHLILSHSAQGSVLPPVTDKPINPLENCSIATNQGWQ